MTNMTNTANMTNMTNMTKTIQGALEQVLGQCGLSVSGELLDKVAIHYEGMVEWNQTHNLTRVESAEDAALKHYADCLVPLLRLPPPPTAEVLDVGSGAGFPGLLAALVWTDHQLGAVEPALKRASFLRWVSARMGVKFPVFQPGTKTAPVVISRATFPPGERGPLFKAVGTRPVGPSQIWLWSTTDAMWEKEVSTWGNGSSTAVPIEIPGLESRFLLQFSGEVDPERSGNSTKSVSKRR
jgi:hypothetical protein